MPAVALGQEEIYRLEIGIVVFYGGLVVLTPFFFGAWRGRFPTEVSARGAAFPDDAAEKVEGSLKGTDERVDTLATRITKAEQMLDRARLDGKI